MRKEISKKQFINGTLWKILETFMTVGTSFIVSWILAILLGADAFGVIAIANVVINFSEILLSGAFSAPLIQKDDVTDADYTSVLGFSLVVSAVLYGLVFLFAPIVADIYDQEILTRVLRLISLIFFFQAFGSVRTAIISRNMKFKTLSLCTIIASVTSGIIGIVLAKCEFGVFSLVAQKLSYQVILNVLLFIIIKWKPQTKGLSFSRVKGLLSFGSKVLGSSLASYVSDSSVTLVTGKAYSVTDLGYCTKGTQYPCDLSIFSFQAVATSLFPTLSSYQSNPDAQKNIMRKVVSTVTFLLFPMMIGMLTVSGRLIAFMLPDEWIFAVPYMKIACVYYCATPLMLINIQLYHSRGNGNVRLMIESIKLVLTVLCLSIGIGILDIHLETLMIFRTGTEVLIALISAVGLKKAINYSYKEYVIDMLPPLLQSLLMALVVVGLDIALGSIGVGNTIILFSQMLAGAITYFVLSLIIKPVGFVELLKIIKGRKNGEKSSK